MDYCKAYNSKENYCLKRMSCEWYLSALRNAVVSTDKFFNAPFEEDRKEQKCKKFKQIK
jgi:hypothetical protein